MHKYIVGTAKGLSADPIAVGGTDDHVHLFARLRPTHSISDFMRELKKASSTIGKSKDGRFAWQEGYAVFSVGRTEADMIAKYVRGQEEHHRTRTSAEELEQLLREHGIEYDPRYFE
jgi:REP element-mobilizing transposase RayT